MNNAGRDARKGDNMHMTLEQVQERYEAFAETNPSVPEMRAEVKLLIQRAGDAAVPKEQEELKRMQIETLQWLLDEIDAGRVQR